jgi:ParB-like chromosome segregation protein Spo0J
VRLGTGNCSFVRTTGGDSSHLDAGHLSSLTAPGADLIPYSRNAATLSEAQIELIEGSSREYGFNNPVLVYGARGVIAGIERALAARRFGMADEPVIALTHLSDTQNRA